MEKIKVILNRESNTHDVWFDEAEKEFISFCYENAKHSWFNKDERIVNPRKRQTRCRVSEIYTGVEDRERRLKTDRR